MYVEVYICMQLALENILGVLNEHTPTYLAGNEIDSLITSYRPIWDVPVIAMSIPS